MMHVFLSYSHRDATAVAERLFHDLEAKGYQPWLDRARLTAGESWTVEIEATLDRCDAVIALLSHASYLSDICRAEQLRSLRKGKRVLPVLIAANAERPLYLETKHYLDLSLHYSAEEVIRALDGQSSAVIAERYRTPYVTAPPLPANLVSRVDEVRQVRELILRESEPPQMGITAVCGMGGLGKTVLAQELCHDDVVQAAFPDGVIWVHIGQTAPETLASIREAARALGDSSTGYESPLAAQNAWRSLIQNKAALIVLDDVWDARHLEPFRAEAARCRLLFTTRDRRLVAAAGAREYELGTMNEPEARTLLSKWAQRRTDDLPDVADSVIAQCGRLPLALSMVGAQLRGRSDDRWQNMLTALEASQIDRVAVQFSHYPHAGLLKALDVSVASLDDAARTRYLSLAVFPENASISAGALEIVWKTTRAETDSLVDLLCDVSLARRNDGGNLLLHDTQADFVRAMSGAARVAQLQDELLAAYGARCNGEWPDCPDDGYIYQHLCWHLIAAGRKAEAFSLVTATPRWMQQKWSALGTDSSLSADIELCLKSTTDLLESIQLYICQHLITQRAERLYDSDLVTLVWLGRAEQALGEARLRRQESSRFDGIVSIDRACREQGRPRPGLTLEAARIARLIPDHETRSAAFRTLALQARECDPTSWLNEAKEAAAQIERPDKGVVAQVKVALTQYRLVGGDEPAQTLTAIIDDLPHESRDEALAVVAEGLARAGQPAQAISALERMSLGYGRSTAIATVLTIWGQRSPLPDSATVDRMRGLIGELNERREVERAQVLLSTITREPSETLELIARVEEESERSFIARDVVDIFGGRGLLRPAQEAAALATHQPFSTDSWTSLGELLLDSGDSAAVAVINKAIALPGIPYDRRERLLALLVRARLYAEATEFLRIRPRFQGRSIALALKDFSARGISATWLRTLRELLSEPDSRHDEALREVAYALVREGDPEGEKLFRTITAPREQDRQDNKPRKVRWAADVAWRSGHRDISYGFAQHLDGGHKVDLLLDLARGFLGLGEAARAAQVLAEAQDYAGSHEKDRERMLLFIAADQFNAGLPTAAPTLESALRIIFLDDKARRTPSLLGSFDDGDSVPADADSLRDFVCRVTGPHLDAAFDVAMMILSWRPRAQAMAHLAERCARLGDPRADEAFARSREAAFHDQQRWGDRAEALQALMLACAATGRTQEALEIAAVDFQEDGKSRALLRLTEVLLERRQSDEALDIARSIHEESYRGRALVRVAMFYAPSEKALSFLQEAERYAQSLSQTDRQSAILQAVVRGFIALDDVRSAAEVMERIAQQDWKASAMMAVAAALWPRDEHAANLMFERAAFMASSISEQRVRDVAIANLANTLARIGRFREAMDTLRALAFDDFVAHLYDWTEVLEQQRDGMSWDVLRHVARIGGWFSPAWDEINQVIDGS